MSEQTDILELDAAIDSAFQRHGAGENGDSLLDTLASFDDLEWPERDIGERIAARLTTEPSIVPLKRRRPTRTALAVGVTGLVASLILILVAFLAFPSSHTTKATSVPTAGKWKLAGYYETPGFRQTGLAGLAGPMTCPSVSTCYIVNSELTPNEPGHPLLTLFAVSVSHDHGATWSGVPTSGISSFTTGLSCPASTNDEACLAGGAKGTNPVILTTTDGGASWASVALPSGAGHLSDLACSSLSHCVGTFTDSDNIFVQQGNAAVTDDAGATWTPANTLGDLLNRVVCNGSTCIANASSDASSSATPVTLFSQDGGTTWAVASLPAGVMTDAYPDQMSCPTEKVCWAIGYRGSAGLATSSVVIVSTDGGATWTLSPSPPSTTALFFAISCASTDDCWLGSGGPFPARGLTGGPELWHTTDGGTSWTTTDIATSAGPPSVAPDSLMGIGQLSCSGQDVCVALGQGDPGARYTASYSNAAVPPST